MTDLLPPAKVSAQALFDVASAAAAGTLLNRLWLGAKPNVELARRLHRWLILASAAMLLALPLELLLLAATMSAATDWQTVWNALPDVLGTHVGHALERAIVCAASLFALTANLPVMRRRLSIVFALGWVAAVLFMIAPLGHASSDGDWTMREAMQWLHLLSVDTWGGGVLLAGLVTVPRLDQPAAFLRRLSLTVTVALGVVLASGLYNSWRGLGGSLALLPHTPWGEILLAKVTLVLLAVALGARVRLMLTDLCHDAASTQAMHRWLRIEALTMLAILLLSACLANALPPAATDSTDGGLAIPLFSGISSHAPVRARPASRAQ